MKVESQIVHYQVEIHSNTELFIATVFFSPFYEWVVSKKTKQNKKTNKQNKNKTKQNKQKHLYNNTLYNVMNFCFQFPRL